MRSRFLRRDFEGGSESNGDLHAGIAAARLQRETGPVPLCARRRNALLHDQPIMVLLQSDLGKADLKEVQRLPGTRIGARSPSRAFGAILAR